MPTSRDVTARMDAMHVTDAEAQYLLGHLTDEDPALVNRLLDVLVERRAGEDGAHG